MNTNRTHPLLTLLLFITIGFSLMSCAAIQKAEQKAGAFIGLTPASVAALNVSLEKDALNGLLELADEKPGMAATDTAFAALDDLANQIRQADSGAGTAVVTLTANAQKALGDYKAKAGKAQLLTDGMKLALSVLTATTPTTAPAVPPAA